MNEALEKARRRTAASGRLLSGHRRVGLMSFAFLIVGGGWIVATVLPGLQPSTTTEGSIAKQGSLGGWPFSLLSWLTGHSKKIAAEPSPTVSPSPRSDVTEAAFLSAPIELSLQLLLASNQYSASYDPRIAERVSFSNVGEGLPVWKVIGRVIGSAPTPGVQIVHRWDTYYIMPRDTSPFGFPYSATPSSPPSPIPVPASEGRTTHRMAGYVTTTYTSGQPPLRMALIETRIPGEPPRWRAVHEGEVIPRHPVEPAPAGRAPDEDKYSPMVTHITADHLVLETKNSKPLVVPLAKQGVPDTFGFTADKNDIQQPDSTGMPEVGNTVPGLPRPSDDQNDLGNVSN